MVLRESNGRDGWHTDTNSVASMGFDALPAQAPQHPIPTMQGAFEESMIETLQETDNTAKDYAKADSLTRRRMLLERETYERTVAGRWKQKSGENFHPLWKLVAQISFGMHLLHQGLAKSDEEVIKILQTHVDEIDGFLERTTEDLDLAQRDINERIRYLKLPLEHGDVFDNMLMDRKFRNAILDGNEKIEHIVDRTSIALRDTLKDVRKGFDGTRELARYFRKLDKSWENQTEEHMGVYAAMMGNTEGWTSAYVDLQNKGNVLHDSLTELSSIIAEIQRRVGIASRKNIPSNASSRANTQPPSRVASIYSTTTPQSPGQKPHITSAIGTGVRRQASANQSISERSMQDNRPWTGGSHRAQPSGASMATESSKSRGHSRRGSDDSNNRRVSFSEYSQQPVLLEPPKRSSGSTNKRHSKEGFKTSWFRKSVEQTLNREKDKDKRKSTASMKEDSPSIKEGESILRSSSLRAPAQTVTPKESPQPSQAVISAPAPSPPKASSPPTASPQPRMSESIGIQNHLKNRESTADPVLEEVPEEDAEIESEVEPEVEIVQASQVQSRSKDNLAREVNIASPSSPTTQKPTSGDLPLREVQSFERVSDSPPQIDLDNGPSLTEAVAALPRSSTIHGSTRNSQIETAQGPPPTEVRPDTLKVQRVSSFDPFDKEKDQKEEQRKSSPTAGAESSKLKSPAKRPANLKLFPTIPVSPGPSTAPLASSKPLYSPMEIPSPRSGHFATKHTSEPNDDVEDDIKEPAENEEANGETPRTPAERGRSPPPPERVPTPMLKEREVSPSLRALTSATVNGPEPDFPFGWGEEGEEETSPRMVAELGDGRRTADGSRSATPEHAELGADSPATRHTKAMNAPFNDPETAREQMQAQMRERELRTEAEKKKVQEQIMSRVVQKASMDLSSRDINGSTGDTTRLHAPPQVQSDPSPVNTSSSNQQYPNQQYSNQQYPNQQYPNQQYPNQQYLHPKSVPLEQASPTTPLPFSRHNRSSARDLKSLLKRFFRIGRDKDRERRSVPAFIDNTAEHPPPGPPPMQRRGFSLSQAFGLSHRRKRSHDNRLNMQGGLQPFGLWRNTSHGMSWGDTRRGSFSNNQQHPQQYHQSALVASSGRDTDTDEGSPDGRAHGGPTRAAGDSNVPGAVPRPQKGTMDIPGVGSIDWSRASAYMRNEQGQNAAVQSLLKDHGSAQDGDHVPPVPPVPVAHKVAPKPVDAEEADEEYDEDEYEEDQEEEDDQYDSSPERIAQADTATEDAHVKATSPGNVHETAEDEDSEASSQNQVNVDPNAESQVSKMDDTDDESEGEADYAEGSEDASRHPSVKADSTHSHHSERSEHSEHSEHSEGTAARSSLATSSMLARKSDATPTTGLSLHFQSPLTNGAATDGKHHAEETQLDKPVVRAASTASAKDGITATALAPNDDNVRTGGLGRSLSATNPAAAAAAASTMAARSPALGADRMTDPMDRAGSQLQQRDSTKAHDRESLGVREGSSSPPSKETTVAPTSSPPNPPRSSSLGHTMLQDGSSSEEEGEEEEKEEEKGEKVESEAGAVEKEEEEGEDVDEEEPALEPAKAQEPMIDHVAETMEEDPLAQRDSIAPMADIADADTKPALVVMAGGDTVEHEPTLKVDEVMRERDHGNGTPF